MASSISTARRREAARTCGRRLLTLLGAVALAVAVVQGMALTAGKPSLAQTNERLVPEERPVGGAVPGETLGTTSDSEIWRAVRQGVQGKVSLPDRRAGVMIQSEGENWRIIRNGPITVGGAWVVLGFLGIVALYFAIRGRIRVAHGFSGRTIERFNALDRSVHWMTAVSFIVLALSGLNMLYGRHTLLPLLGPEVFAAITRAGKYAHNYIAFAFMLGLVMMFVLWVRHNLPNRYDLVWLVQGGGMFSKGVHPPARKFNAGQKILFWVVILGGASVSLSGVALLFPYELSFFGPTFKLINALGINLPTELTALEEMQLSQGWHAVVSLVLIAVIIGHIYLGSLGMEGAFDAMGTGYVDENWAREHHSVWVAELKGEPVPDPYDEQGGGQTQPAE